MQDKFIERNKVKRFLEKAYSYRENVVVFTQGESKAHFLKKCEVCWELQSLGISFICEARFAFNRGRADILVLEGGGCAIELVVSEPNWSIDLKRQKYPVPIVTLGLAQVFEEKMIR